MSLSPINSPVPEWADFFSPEEYAAFFTQLDNYFVSQNIDYTTDDGIVTVTTERFGGAQLGLSNLAQWCKQRSIEEWQELIEQHFELMAKNHIFDEEFSSKAHDFDYVREYLGVRLYHKDYLSHMPGNKAITRPVTEDIVAMLVYDFPHAIKSVNGDDIGPWNKSADELLEIGKENIRQNYEIELNREELGDKECWVVNNDHFYSPNILLNLDSYPEAVGNYGTLVGVPTRHLVFLYPVDNLEVVDIITMFTTIVPQLNYDGPGSISPCIFWHYNNTFTNIPFEIDNESLRIIPPDNFVEVLNNMENDVAEGN